MGPLLEQVHDAVAGVADVLVELEACPCDVAGFERRDDRRVLGVRLGVALDEIVHVGDRDHNDVKGPHAIGAKAILFTGSRPDDAESTTADAVCAHHSELPAVVDRLAAQS